MEAVETAAAALRAAEDDARALAGTEPERLHRTAGLLRDALSFHAQHPDATACPVCRSAEALTSDWADAARAELERINLDCRSVESARTRLDAAQRQLATLRPPSPRVFGRVQPLGLDDGCLAARWGEFLAAPPSGAADALRSVAEALICVRENAALELEKREGEWRGVHPALTAYIARARLAREGDARVDALKQAAAWLDRVTEDCRTERFAPIAEQARQLWDMLRQDSNVEVGRLDLVGKGTKRQVTLDVPVDGVAAAGLTVISQGELNAPALSLFLPRATLPESPFGFVVIDDPVQSMDPARVDGLALALESTARVRQVIVFIHDARLPESVRRMGIPARVIELKRREGSAVEMRQANHPVQASLDDARALALTRELDARVRMRVIPGFCREAIETACTEVVRRRRLLRGEPYAEVEQLLEKALTLRDKALLAFFDQGTGNVDWKARADSIAHRGGQTLTLCNKGAHGASEFDPEELIRNTDALTQAILALR